MNFNVIAVLALVILGQQSPDGDQHSREQVRRIVLRSRHLGAHGIGYNDDSLKLLADELKPSDIPVLISLAMDEEVRVGVQFALASQCDNAIAPIRQAAVDHKMGFWDAQDTMRLIENFAECNASTRQVAASMRAEIQSLQHDDELRAQKEAQDKAADDARIQENAIKMMDPKRSKQLTRLEREEVYKRSLKAMGLSEDGPLTPTQRDLVQRMYRTMVLGKSESRPPN